MNCVKQQTIKIVEGNAFTLIFPLKRRTYVSNKPIDEDIIIADLTDVVVKFGGVEYASIADPRGLMVAMPATLEKATYNAIITAKYHGAEIQAAYFECVTIVAWNFQSDAQEYIQGSPIAVAPAYVIGGPLTDAELEALKAELRLDIAAAEAAKEAAEAAKEEYEQKAEELDMEAIEKKVMGADSQATWDCGPSIPAASFDSGSFNCIVSDDDKYWLDYNEDVAGSDAILVGDVCRASELDATNGYKICTNYVSPFPFLNGNVGKSGDDYYLLYGTGTTFVAVEANKNYRCKEIVNLAYQPNPQQPSSTITGKLYIWEEYEGESIKDGVEEVKDFVAEEAAGLAKQGTNASATLTATQTAATNAYASAEAAKTGVVDGNDTAISVAKEIRSEVGTGSDTAAETGTLFAVVKWVKDKVKDVYSLIGYTISEIDGI